MSRPAGPSAPSPAVATSTAETVRRFRDTDLDQILASAHERRPAGVLEPFKPYLNTRFTESLGQVSGSRLFLEIRERGSSIGVEPSGQG
ncbi:hypothetical protein [Streptomyces sp. NPDC006463]|uniref:hypothetical protein n=1 Tax=Streptomyces sp. NPDC006463 TaxID=3364746 RepID=UPI0036B8F662